MLFDILELCQLAMQQMFQLVSFHLYFVALTCCCCYCKGVAAIVVVAVVVLRSCYAVSIS